MESKTQMPYLELRKEYFGQLFKNQTDEGMLRNIKMQILGSNSRHLYKYCSIETALKILESGNILLKAPDNFNDPFDCLARVGTWNSKTQFGPNEKDIIGLKEFIKKLPEKFQLQEYRIFNDLRASYCFAITCLTSNYRSRLMWSHYSNNHKDVCFEFEIDNILGNLHPCFYTDSMPDLNWGSDNISLSLIKEKAWQFEDEWRLVKPTIRPMLRMFRSITDQIYNAVHENSSLKQKDYEEWEDIQSSLMKSLEKIYHNECSISIRPSRIFLGFLYEHNYTNTKTGDSCRRMISFARENAIPLHKIVAQPYSFELSDVPAVNLPSWY